MYVPRGSISIIVPALNEEHRLETTFREILEAAARCFLEYEVIIVNDGSTDRTGEIADRLRATSNCVRVIHHTRPHCLGGAVRAGLSLAHMDYVTTAHGDGGLPLEERCRIWRRVGEADLIIPYNLNHAARPFFPRLVSATFRALVNVLFGTRLKYHMHFVVHRRELLESIRIHTNSYAYQAEAIVKLLRRGHSYLEIGVGDEFNSPSPTRSYSARHFWAVAVFFATTLWNLYFTRNYRIPAVRDSARAVKGVCR